jgi:hypothetical protein
MYREMWGGEREMVRSEPDQMTGRSGLILQGFRSTKGFPVLNQRTPRFIVAEDG